jgi:two-component system LytT family response regulator
MTRAIIVDDERLARKELRTLLRAFPDVEIVGDASSLSEARSLVERAQPELIFLDVQLGRASGFDLLDAIDERTSVIFVTAYDQHALRAFDVHALDYLLKPVEPARLERALRRHLSPSAPMPGESSAPTAGAPRLTLSDWLFLRAGERRSFVKVGRITHLVADGDYVTFHTDDGRRVRTHSALRQWEQRLPPSFLRVQRAVIVNLEFVTRAEPWSHYSYQLTIRGLGEPVVMSRRYASRARDLLG